MDWSNVTLDELVTSLKEVCAAPALLEQYSVLGPAVASCEHVTLVHIASQVDWKTPPRPLSEFFTRFSFPKTQQKLQQRFKCNVYYYRSNYAVIVLVSCIVALVRRPTALLGILGLGFGLLCLNDTFATMLRYSCTPTCPKSCCFEVWSVLYTIRQPRCQNCCC